MLLQLIVRKGSGPMGGVSAPFFARKSALSFPTMPTCALTLIRLRLLCLPNLFSNFTVSIVSLEEDLPLLSWRRQLSESENMLIVWFFISAVFRREATLFMATISHWLIVASLPRLMECSEIVLPFL